MSSKLNKQSRLLTNSNLWHGTRNATLSLGCQSCPDLHVCGGLSTETGVFECLDFCQCTNKKKCDNVCKGNLTHYVRRVREVNGFEFSQAPRITARAPVLPDVVPVIGNGYSRAEALDVPVAALSLFDLLDRRTGQPKYQTSADLRTAFRLSRSTRIIASGTAKDRALEAWWKLESRAPLLAHLRETGVELITTPNYSVFVDVPRWDNIYNLRRIELSWREIDAAGITSALHLNARTEHDYHRLAALVGESGLTTVAFEFGTGAGWANRIEWHIEQLCHLAQLAPQPLQLLTRGGGQFRSVLEEHFAQVVLLDTDAFLKTLKRRRALETASGDLQWVLHRLPKGFPLDELLKHNIDAVSKQRVKREKQSSIERIQPTLLSDATHRN